MILYAGSNDDRNAHGLLSSTAQPGRRHARRVSWSSHAGNDYGRVRPPASRVCKSTCERSCFCPRGPARLGIASSVTNGRATCDLRLATRRLARLHARKAQDARRKTWININPPRLPSCPARRTVSPSDESKTLTHTTYTTDDAATMSASTKPDQDLVDAAPQPSTVPDSTQPGQDSAAAAPQPSTVSDSTQADQDSAAAAPQPSTVSESTQAGQDPAAAAPQPATVPHSTQFPPPCSMVSDPMIKCVKCADPSVTGDLLSTCIPLGPLDYISQRISPISAVYFYAASGRDSVVVPSELLERAFAQALNRHPHLTGRLWWDNDRPSHLLQFHLGAIFETTQSTRTLASFSSTKLPSMMYGFNKNGREFLPVVGYCVSEHDAHLRERVLGIRHTRFACDSVALGITIMSAVADACGLLNFVRDLCELYRLHRFVPLHEQPPVAPQGPPPIVWPYLDSLTYEMTESQRERWKAYSPQSYAALDRPSRPSWTMDVVRLQFRLPRDFIQTLIDKAAEEGFHGLTAFDMVAALVCRTAMQPLIVHGRRNDACRQEISGCTIQTAVSVDWRNRLQLGTHYPFNGATLAIQEWSNAHDLRSKELGEVAQMIKSQTEAEDVDSLLTWAAARAGSSELRCWTSERSELSYNFRKRQPTCVVTCWHEHDLYASAILDGAQPTFIGRPWDVRVDQPGCAYMLEGPEGIGSFDVYWTVTKEEWRLLLEDYGGASQLLAHIVG